MCRCHHLIIRRSQGNEVAVGGIIKAEQVQAEMIGRIESSMRATVNSNLRIPKDIPKSCLMTKMVDKTILKTNITISLEIATHAAGSIPLTTALCVPMTTMIIIEKMREIPGIEPMDVEVSEGNLERKSTEMARIVGRRGVGVTRKWLERWTRCIRI